MYCSGGGGGADGTRQASTVNWCGGEWGYPAGCSGTECQYYASWEYLEDSDRIQFVVKSSSTKQWTGIGFSDNTRMVRRVT